MNQIFKELTFNDLQILKSLSEEKSLRSIARSQMVEPTALSKRLSRIEELFGFEIIKRSSRGFVLTGEGEKLIDKITILYKSAEAAFFSKGSTSKFERIITMGSRGFLNILSADSFLMASSRLSSNSRLRFIDMSPDELQKATFDNIIDMALHFENLNLTAVWSTFEIGQISWQVFARKNHPLSQKESISEILKYPFIGPGYLSGNKLSLGDDGFSIPWEHRIKGHEVQTAMTAFKILKNTDQLVYLPTLLAQDALLNNDIKMIEITNLPVIKKPIYFSVQTEKITQKELVIFTEFLKKMVNNEIHQIDIKPNLDIKLHTKLNKQPLQEISL